MLSANFTGGLGDLTLCLDNMALYDEIYMCCHADVNTIHNFLYILAPEIIPKVKLTSTPKEGIVPCTRNKYSNTIQRFKDTHTHLKRKYEDKYVLHPYGSRFANQHAIMTNRAQKLITIENIQKFADKYGASSVILGSSQEIGFIRSHNIEATHLSLEEQIAAAIFGKKLIAIDSLFKTIRLATKTPTTVIMPDYSDPIRDEWFITPYVSDGILKPFYYTDVSTFNIEDTFET